MAFVLGEFLAPQRLTTTAYHAGFLFDALRSLFRFAKRHLMVFADPSRRLHVVHAVPTRALLPMTDV